MVGPRPVRGPRTGRARPPFEEGRAPGLDHLRVEGKPEVVIAREHDHLLALQVNGCALLGVHGMVEGGIPQPHLRRVVLAAAPQYGLLVLQEKGDRHAGMTLRPKPAFANANGTPLGPRKSTHSDSFMRSGAASPSRR